MPAKKITWQEKLNDSKGYPKVEEIKGKMSKKWGAGTVVIPAPIEVDQLMRKVPKGKLTTINEIRSALATKHKATIGCPLTTGIFAWISAYAAEEQKTTGKNRHYSLLANPKNWRILKREIPRWIGNSKAAFRARRTCDNQKGQEILC